MEKGDDRANPEPAKLEVAAGGKAGGAASIRGRAGGREGEDESSDGR